MATRNNRETAAPAETVAAKTVAITQAERAPRGVLSITYDSLTKIMTMAWSDGVRAELDVSKLSDDVLEQARIHGLRQKLGDAAAMSRNPETGQSATIADKRARVDAVAQYLRDGHWTAPTRATPETSNRAILVDALCRLNTSADRAKIADAIAAKTPAEIAAMSAVPRVASVIAAIRAERSAVSAESAESMLDELIG